MNRCGRLAFLSRTLCRGLVAAALFTAVGCGEEELSDDAYGAIDLTPFYADGATPANPRAAVPTELPPLRGWYEGRRAEFYDFGIVNHRRKRNAAGATIREPDIAFVNPMYFFFDANGRPMFSRPLFDERTGAFTMKGGQNLLNPNPNPGPEQEGTARDRYYELPYSQRLRSTVGDPGRGNSADYQRPIIDKLQNDATYTGLWEVVHVKVQGGYAPDAIKSAKTLLEARDANKVQIVRTGKAINCPVIEEATWVVPTPTSYRQARDGQAAYMVPQPRVEIWYRTKLGYCFLANGIETIANVNGDGRSFENIELFNFNET